MGDFLGNENTIVWPRKQGLRKLLGDLELAVMERFWQQPASTELTIRTVFDMGLEGKKLAYTTVMTTVQRLADKGILAVDRDVYPHRYWAPMSLEEFTRKAVGQLLDSLLSDFGEPALAHLADAVAQGGERADRLFEELERRRRSEEA